MAFGMGGEEVTITHKGGLKSASMPYQARMGNINSPDTPTVVVPPPLPADPLPSGDGTCDKELKDAVNGFKPEVNLPSFKCGTWYDMSNHSSGKNIVMFKNGCAPTLKTIFTVTMKKTDWAEAKTMMYADGDKYTPLDKDSCKDSADSADYMECAIQLRKIGGVAQDSAGFLIPKYHGSFGISADIQYE